MSSNQFRQLNEHQQIAMLSSRVSLESAGNFRQGFGFPPHKIQSRIGFIKKIPAAATRFMQKQTGALAQYKVDPKFWLPAWVRAHVENKGSIEALVTEIVKRVEKDPHHNTLQEAHFLLNELGRDPRNSCILRQHITNDLVRKIANGAGKKSK